MTNLYSLSSRGLSACARRPSASRPPSTWRRKSCCACCSSRATRQKANISRWQQRRRAPLYRTSYAAGAAAWLSPRRTSLPYTAHRTRTTRYRRACPACTCGARRLPLLPTLAWLGGLPRQSGGEKTAAPYERREAVARQRARQRSTCRCSAPSLVLSSPPKRGRAFCWRFLAAMASRTFTLLRLLWFITYRCIFFAHAMVLDTVLVRGLPSRETIPYLPYFAIPFAAHPAKL